MKPNRLLLLAFASLIIIACHNNTTDNKEDIIIENDQAKLIISKDGYSKSLVCKPTNEECLVAGKKSQFAQ
jgi:hypothetical protein